ncbi:sensor histidine kinase [Roseivivax sp. CAU 1753]
MAFTGRKTHLRYALSALACIGAVIAASLFTNNLLLERERTQVRLELRDDAQLIRMELERDLQSLAQVANGVSAAISRDPDIDQDVFSKIVSRVIQDDASAGHKLEILNIAASSDLIVRFTYPYERNKDVVGVDYRDVPEQREMIERVKKSGRLLLTDPVELVQGGRGIIARVPVSEFDSGNIWGVISVVGSLSAIFGHAEDTARELGLSFAVYKTETSWPIFGEPSVYAKDPLNVPVQVPGGETWNMSVVPASGWPVSPSNAVFTWITYSLLGAMAFVTLTLFYRAADARQLAEKQLRLAIDGIADGFAIYDPQDRLVICNDAYRRFYPRSAKKMVAGTTFRDIIQYGIDHGEYLDAIGCEEEWLDQRLAAHKCAEHSVVQRLADGRWLKVFERRLTDGSIVGFRVDISELMEAREAAEAGSRAKSLFLDRMSHELRTPLAILLGYLSFIEQPSKIASYKRMLEACDPEDAAEFEKNISTHAGRIRKSGKQLLGMVDRVLDISETERRSGQNAPEVLPLDDILFSATNNIEWSPQSRPTVHMPDGTRVAVLADGDALSNALTAVFRHCYDAFPDGKVDITVKQYTASIELFVDTRGKRAVSVLEAKVFHRAFEALDSKRGSEMSLDLAIAERLIAQARGGFFYKRLSDTQDRIEISIPRAHLELVQNNAA